MHELKWNAYGQEKCDEVMGTGWALGTASTPTSSQGTASTPNSSQHRILNLNKGWGVLV